MSEPLTPERRAALRRLWLKPPGEYSVCIPARELTALLDAADERDRLAAAVGRVRALHPRGTVEMITATDCVNEDCEHEGDCPTEPVEACQGCVDFAELATLYALEHADVQDRVAWPCAHIRALDGTDA